MFGPTAITFPNSTGYNVTNTLATNFTWDGTSNLVVEYCYTFTGVGLITSYGGCRRTNTAVVQMIHNGGAAVTCASAYATNVSAIPNVKFTVTSACTQPSPLATSMNFTGLGTTGVTVNWTNGGGTNRVVVAHATSAVSAGPSTGTNYTAGANSIFGSGTNLGSSNFVVYAGTGSSVAVSNLTPGTTYHFAVYEASATYCYSAGLAGSQAIPTCIPPTGPATSITFGNLLSTSNDVNWVRGNGSTGVVVVARLTATALVAPTSGSTYTANNTFGAGTGSAITGAGNFVVYVGTGTTVNVNTLIPSTVYTYSVYEYSGTCYGSAASLAQTSASCSPALNATGLAYSAITNNAMTTTWVRGSGTNVLVVARLTATTRVFPTYNATYTTNTAFGAGTGSAITGTGNFVVYNGTGTSVNVTGMANFTGYTFDVYEYNATPNCYWFATPLTSSQSTLDGTTSGGCAASVVRGGTIMTAITPTTTLQTANTVNTNYTNQPIGFTFNYGGTNYTTFGLNTNGYIWFGTGAPLASATNPLSNASANLGGTGTIDGIISAMGTFINSNYVAPTVRDIGYTVTVIAPNRILTIQWRGYSASSYYGLWYSFGYTDCNRQDFQIKLNESGGTLSNQIVLAYSNQTPLPVDAASSAQVGIRGATNATFTNRTGNGANWGNAAGTLNTNTCNTTASTYITGATITITQAVTTGPTINGVASGGSGTNPCPATSLLLTAGSGFTSYQWFLNGSIIPGPGSNSSTYTATSSGTYSVVGKNGTCYAQSSGYAVTISSCNIPDDAGVTLAAFATNPVCSPTQDLTVTVKNFGTNALSSVRVNYTINGGSSNFQDFTFGTPIATGASTTVTLTALNLNKIQNNSIVVSTSLPSGQTDGTPANDSYTYSGVNVRLNGTYSVGTGQEMTSLTGTGGLFSTIGTVGLAGNVTVNIISDITESGANALTQWTEYNPTTCATTTGNYTLNIQSDGTVRTLSGSYSADLLFRIIGADRVTISGGTGTQRLLVLRNTDATYGTINFGNDCVNDKINNCDIQSNGSGVQVYALAAATASVTIENNDIHNDVTNLASLPSYGIYVSNTSAVVTITSNKVYNYFYGGIYAVNAANGCSITGNSCYLNGFTIAIGTYTNYGIYVNYGNGHIITGNTIGGGDANGTGLAYTVTSNGQITGIYYAANAAPASTTPTDISGNFIQNIALTSNSSPYFYGIDVENGKANIGKAGSGNVIGNANSALGITVGGASASNTQVRGIFTIGTAATDIENISYNTITNITNNGTGTISSLRGIKADGSGTGISIDHNTITNLTTYGRGSNYSYYDGTFTTYTSNTYQLCGILISNTNSGGSPTISDNTISGLKCATTSAVGPAVVGIGVDRFVSGSIFRNKLTDFTNTATGTTAYLQPGVQGIRVWDGTWKVYNNQIILTNDNNTNFVRIYGINECSGLGTNYFYNSVYLGGSQNTGTNATAAFIQSDNSSSLVLRNNMFYNVRSNTGGATSNHYCLYVIPASAPTAFNSNNNLLYAPGANHFIGQFNSANQTTIANWRTVLTPNIDLLSQNNLVLFNQSNPPTSDLTPNATTNCWLDGKGTPITTTAGFSINVADDYLAATRNTSTPDIGAIEFTGTPATLSFAATDVTCNGGSNGAINLTVSNGNSPFTYIWSTNASSATTEDVTGLAAATYSVTVKDALLCEVTASQAVSQPALLSPTITSILPANALPGSNVTITGTDFTATGNSVTIGVTTLTVVTESSTSIVVTLPALGSGVCNGNVVVTNSCSNASVGTAYTIGCGPNTWLGGSAGWIIPTNWSYGAVPTTCSDNVLIPTIPASSPIGTPIYPVIGSGSISVGDLTVQDGASIAVNNTQTLSVCGNFTGGSSTASSITTNGTGKLIFNGSGTQTFSGRASFPTLRVNKTSGSVIVQNNSFFDVFTALELQAGALDNSGNTGGLFTLKSNATAHAIFNDFGTQTPPVTFSGTFTFGGTIYEERYYSTPNVNSYNQHYMGSPVSNADVAQFGASGSSGTVTPVTPTSNCSETQLDVSSAYGSVFTYNQATGAACPMASWNVAAGGSNATPLQGYSVARTGSGTLTVHGTPNTVSSYSLSGLSNSNWNKGTLQHNSPTAFGSGWQLVSNPYNATLDLSSATVSGFDNQLQVWNALTGGYTAYVIGSSTIAIAPFQAFFVHKSSFVGVSTYTINGSNRVVTAQTFYAQNTPEQLSIRAINNANSIDDVATVGFNTNATDVFDADFDANKLTGSIGRHNLYSMNNGYWLNRNILHSIAQTSTVDVGFEPGTSGSYTLTFEGLNSFDPTSYITLEDKKLNIFYDVRTGDYNFTSDAADDWNRFVLHFTPKAEIATVNQNCNTLGTINITQPGTANWTYTVTDNNNATISSGTLNQSTPVTVNAQAGTYTLTLIDANNYTVVKNITISGTQPVTATATVSSTAVETTDDVTFTNTTANATTTAWDFGDGTTSANTTEVHAYTTAGTYTVTLTVTNAGGCSSTTTQTVTATEKATTGLNNITNSKGISIWSNENKVFIDFSKQTKVEATIEIYNVLGQQLVNEKFGRSTVYTKSIGNLEAAYVIVKVKNDNEIITKKLLITNK